MSHKKFCITDYLKVGLRVNSNGPKLIREFLLSIFRSEAFFGHPVHVVTLVNKG